MGRREEGESDWLNHMQCKHEKISIREQGSSFTNHDREEDGTWTHDNRPGAYRLTLRVECRKCDKHWNYSKQNAPAWLKKYLSEIDI